MVAPCSIVHALKVAMEGYVALCGAALYEYAFTEKPLNCPRCKAAIAKATVKP